MFITATNLAKGLNDVFESNEQEEMMFFTSLLTIVITKHGDDISDIDKREKDEFIKLDKEIVEATKYSVLSEDKPTESLIDIVKIISDVWNKNLKNVPKDSILNVGEITGVFTDFFDLFFKDGILKFVVETVSGAVINVIQMDSSESEENIKSMLLEVINYPNTDNDYKNDKKEARDLGLLN